MKAALINAHVNYAPGTSGIVDNVSYNEYKLSSQINTELKKILETGGIQSQVIDGSAITPYNSSLRYKTTEINKSFSDLAIETHFNSSATSILAPYSSGLEVLYSSSMPENEELAQVMVQELKTRLPFKIRRKDGLWKRDNIYILKNARCPSCIIEVCFLTNYKDRVFLIHPRAIEVIALGIFAGILNFGKKKGLINV